MLRFTFFPGERAVIVSPRIDQQGRGWLGVGNERLLGVALEKQVAHQIDGPQPYPNIIRTPCHTDFLGPELYHLLERCTGNDRGFKRP